MQPAQAGCVGACECSAPDSSDALALYESLCEFLLGEVELPDEIEEPCPEELLLEGSDESLDAPIPLRSAVAAAFSFSQAP